MSPPELRIEEFEHILSEDVAALGSELRAVLQRFSVPLFMAAYEFQGVRGPAMASVWVVAQTRSVVLGYDEAEEAYGVGTLREDGLLDGWDMYDRLEWALRPFAAAAQPAPPAA